MDIIGLGVDATDIPRMRGVYERYGDRFLQRIFTDGRRSPIVRGSATPFPASRRASRRRKRR